MSEGWESLLASRRAQWQEAHEQLDLAIGRQYSLYADETLVVQYGRRGILQMFFAAPDEAGHVQALLEYGAFAHGSHILDCGCGTGEMARMLCMLRPDLRITLLNKSLAQLRHCPVPRLAGDMHALPFLDESFDAVLLCYTLGYGAIAPVFREIRRVLKPGGTLVLADMTSAEDTAGTAILLLLGYKCYPWWRIQQEAARSGLPCLQTASPAYCHPEMEQFASKAIQEALFTGIIPVIAVFRREPIPCRTG